MPAKNRKCPTLFAGKRFIFIFFCDSKIGMGLVYFDPIPMAYMLSVDIIP